MLIRTLKHNYTVTRKLRDGNDVEVMVCRDLWKEEAREYLLVVLKNPDLIHRWAPDLVAWQKNPAFQDYLECFAQEGRLTMVFVYHAGPRFSAQWAKEVYSLTERLEIGRNLLGSVVLLNMPAAMLYEALQDRNLLLDAALRVNFNYILEEIPDYQLLTPHRAQMELARVFRVILARELATQVSEEVDNFVRGLEAGAFADYLEVFEAYDQLHDHLLTLQEQGEIQPHSLLFRAWEFIKRMAGYAQPVLAGVIIITALGFLAYTIAHPTGNTSATPGIVIEQIGTVQIK
jgi:hypothetical protein